MWPPCQERVEARTTLPEEKKKKTKYRPLASEESERVISGERKEPETSRSRREREKSTEVRVPETESGVCAGVDEGKKHLEKQVNGFRRSFSSQFCHVCIESMADRGGLKR